MKKLKHSLPLFLSLLSLLIILTGCVAEIPVGDLQNPANNIFTNGNTGDAKKEAEVTGKEEEKDANISPTSPPSLSNGKIVCILNDNIPNFREDEMSIESYEQYSSLDQLGRCGSAMACVGTDIMPREKRGDISEVKPTGWHNKQYKGISSGGWLYNRCHLIAYCLTGENANEKNLITGTRAMNEAMIPYETQIADHVEDTYHHVMYRVTPDFSGNNLVASGVLLESRCSECNECTFCVYCRNIQEGVVIDYATGYSNAA